VPKIDLPDAELSISALGYRRPFDPGHDLEVSVRIHPKPGTELEKLLRAANPEGEPRGWLLRLKEDAAREMAAAITVALDDPELQT
jgi:hypothetical protein